MCTEIDFPPALIPEPVPLPPSSALLKEPEFPGTPPVMVTQLAVKEGVVTAVTKRMY